MIAIPTYGRHIILNGQTSLQAQVEAYIPLGQYSLAPSLIQCHKVILWVSNGHLLFNQSLRLATLIAKLNRSGDFPRVDGH